MILDFFEIRGLKEQGNKRELVTVKRTEDFPTEEQIRDVLLQGSDVAEVVRCYEEVPFS